MSITYAGGLIIVGMIFGGFITLGTVVKMFYDDRWSNGFSAGFDAALQMKEAEKCGD